MDYRYHTGTAIHTRKDLHTTGTGIHMYVYTQKQKHIIHTVLLLEFLWVLWPVGPSL